MEKRHRMGQWLRPEAFLCGETCAERAAQRRGSGNFVFSGDV